MLRELSMDLLKGNYSLSEFDKHNVKIHLSVGRMLQYDDVNYKMMHKGLIVGDFKDSETVQNDMKDFAFKLGHMDMDEDIEPQIEKIFEGYIFSGCKKPIIEKGSFGGFDEYKIFYENERSPTIGLLIMKMENSYESGIGVMVMASDS